MSTSAVCYEIIKPATKVGQCAYTSFLREHISKESNQQSRTPVGRATVFLSHAWANPFLGLVAAAEAHLRSTFGPEGAEEQFLWCAENAPPDRWRVSAL